MIAKIIHQPLGTALAQLIRMRRDVGRRKYGVSMDRTDYTLAQWLGHALEEKLDAANYLQRVIDLEPDELIRAVWEEMQMESLLAAQALLSRMVALEYGFTDDLRQTLMPSQPSTLNRRPGA